MTEPQPPKLCTDCRHVGGNDFTGLRCWHPKVPAADLSNGQRELAVLVRRYGPCHNDARLFEPAPVRVSWWTRMRWRLWRWVRS